MWTPAEIRKLIAQIAGIALGIGGFVLILDGVQATGKLNISSSLLSGEIESGSAGLFLLLLSFMLIALPALWTGRPFLAFEQKDDNAKDIENISSTKRFAMATGAFLLLAVVLTVGGEVLVSRYHFESGVLLVLPGLLFGMLGIGTLLLGILEWAFPVTTKDPRSNQHK